MTETRLTWAVGVLAAFLVAVIFWTWTLAGRVASFDQGKTDLETRFVQTTTNLAAVAKRQDDLETKVADLGIPDIAAVQTELEGVRATLAAVEKRLTDMPNDQLAARLASVESRLNALKSPDLKPLEVALAASQTDIDQLKQEWAELDTMQLRGLGQRVDDIAAQVAALDIPDVAPLTEAINLMKGRVDILETGLADVTSTAPEGLQGKVDALAAKLASLEIPDVTGIETELRTISTDLVQVKPAVAAAATKTDLGAVADDVTWLSSLADGTEMKVTALQGDAADLAVRLSALGDELAKKGESDEVASLAARLETLRQEVVLIGAEGFAQMDTQVGSLRIEVERLTQQVNGLPSPEEIKTLRDEVKRIADEPRNNAPPRFVELIRFGINQSRVASDELAKIEAVANLLASSPDTLEIVGFTDSQGPAEFNRALSLRRASAVRAALVEAGVDPAAVTSVAGLGEDGPPVSADDNVDEADNRVVMIYRRP